MRKSSKPTLLNLAVVLLALICAGCQGATTTPRNAVGTTNATATPETNRDDPFMEFLLHEKLEWMARAWEQFVSNGRYRIARANDFVPEIRDEMQFPYERTAISHEQGFDDFAIVVVDTTRSDQNRFGLVVFNAPADGKTIPSPHWVYRDRDLSRMIIRKWSGGIILSQYKDRLDQESCYLNWIKSKQKYSCDKEYDGSHVGLPGSKSQ